MQTTTAEARHRIGFGYKNISVYDDYFWFLVKGKEYCSGIGFLAQLVAGEVYCTVLYCTALYCIQVSGSWPSWWRGRCLGWRWTWAACSTLSTTSSCTGDGSAFCAFHSNLCVTIRPLAPEDELTSSYRVEDVLDKGRAAAVLVGVETRN